MIINKESLFTGNINSMDLDVTEEQLQEWEGGRLVQDVFPHLTPEEREFLITGATPEEWLALYPDDVGGAI